MTASTTVTGVAASPIFVPDRTVGFRRRTTALLLPIGFAAQIAANATYAWQTRNGGDDQTGEHALRLYGQAPGALQFATVAVLVGVLCIVPGIFAAVRVLRTSAPRLSLIAGVVIAIGYLSYLVLVSSNFVTVALAESGTDAAAALDEEQAMAPVVVFGVLFVLGNLGGPVLLAIAVLRGRAVPRWSAIGILAWPVLHITGLIAGSEWFEVAGGALQVAGLAVIAAAALRMSDAEWARRG